MEHSNCLTSRIKQYTRTVDAFIKALKLIEVWCQKDAGMSKCLCKTVTYAPFRTFNSVNYPQGVKKKTQQFVNNVHHIIILNKVK